MLVVNDAMVMIHLAKLSVLSAACAHFEDATMPTRVYQETVEAGRERGYPDAQVIVDAVDAGDVRVVDVTDDSLVDRANRYNIQGGEAAAVALYWEQDADRLASDDDNVRRKRTVLDLHLIGTPSILVELFEESRLDAPTVSRAIDDLRSIGWFSTALLDKIELEAGLV